MWIPFSLPLIGLEFPVCVMRSHHPPLQIIFTWAVCILTNHIAYLTVCFGTVSSVLILALVQGCRSVFNF